MKKTKRKLPKSLSAPSDDEIEALFNRPDMIFRDFRPHERGDFNAFCSVVIMLLLVLVPSDEHPDKYAALKKLADKIARDPNGDRKLFYLNRFLRTADDVEEREEIARSERNQR
jgi:hypothetical protein